MAMNGMCILCGSVVEESSWNCGTVECVGLVSSRCARGAPDLSLSLSLPRSVAMGVGFVSKCRKTNRTNRSLLAPTSSRWGHIPTRRHTLKTATSHAVLLLRLVPAFVHIPHICAHDRREYIKHTKHSDKSLKSP